jgi:glutamyl-Q tRNA(Asp) synthetase
VVTRFAPSPTGRLHLGHALSAIRAHDFARERGGAFLLRIEDIDGTRSRPEHVHAILTDLRWLGLAWDELSFQSQRLHLYADALEQLRASGLVYPCVCTRAEIGQALSAPHGPVAAYPGTCRGLPAPDLSRPHAWRLDIARGLAEAGPLRWWDGRWIAADPGRQGDVVLARKDAPASYHLAVIVDDAAQGVTDVVRGVDLFEATHVHRLLQALLDLAVPRYHHHPLVLGPDGERLAKRHGSPSLGQLREAGEDGEGLANSLRAGRLPAGYSAAAA